MKRIELKSVQADDNTLFEYKKVLLETLRITREGMTIPEMEQALKIMGQIKSAGASVLVEDADYAFIVQRLDVMRWMVADSAVVQFVRDVKNAVSVDMNDLAKSA